MLFKARGTHFFSGPAFCSGRCSNSLSGRDPQDTVVRRSITPRGLDCLLYFRLIERMLKLAGSCLGG